MVGPTLPYKMFKSTMLFVLSLKRTVILAFTILLMWGLLTQNPTGTQEQLFILKHFKCMAKSQDSIINTHFIFSYICCSARVKHCVPWARSSSNSNHPTTHTPRNTHARTHTPTALVTHLKVNQRHQDASSLNVSMCNS